MKPQMVHNVLKNEEFQSMARKKSRLGWIFSILMFVIYVVYILYIGIDPEAFATPVVKGEVTTWGIYAGLFVILFAIGITGIYVSKANGKYEQMTQRVIDHVTKEEEQS